MKPRYNAHGELSFWFVLPSRNLVNLVEKAILRQYPCINYGLGWKDTNGFGLHMTVCDWKPKNSKHYYRQ